MRLRAFELNEPLPELKEPQALAMLRPWVDVGSVGTLVLSWLESHFEAKELGRLARPGDFFDFTRYRPTSYVKGEQRQVTVPNTYVTYSQQESGNSFLFLHLLEPHSHAEIYVESVLQLLAKFGVKSYCLIGSMYDYVPHTKPLIVTGGASGEKAQQELTKRGIESSDYQGPTSISFLISQRAPEMGMETMSLIVHLPQYTQTEEDYMGTVRIMNVLGSLYDIPVDETYIEKAERQRQQINTALDQNPQLKAIVQQLEAHYEARTEKKKEEETSRLSPEVERFLAEMDKRFREG
jgi:predicted ATP-grasp superfamily ATP-dependent carboligase